MDAPTGASDPASCGYDKASTVTISSANDPLSVTWWAFNVQPSSHYAKPWPTAERGNSCPRTGNAPYEPSDAACCSPPVSRQSRSDAHTWDAFIHEPCPHRSSPTSKRSYRTVTNASSFYPSPCLTPYPSITSRIRVCSTDFIRAGTRLVKYESHALRLFLWYILLFS